MSQDSPAPEESPNATDTPAEVISAPTDFWGILKRLGPGLIIAGSIVGSGELIATTKTGAQAGITLLWLIILGCLIKVFVQIELGRYAITHGETTLIALNRVPGPKARVNWIVWFWLFMMLCTIGQLGGIVGGVGQSLAISAPITGDYRDAIQIPSKKELLRYESRDRILLSEWDLRLLRSIPDPNAVPDETFLPHERDWLIASHAHSRNLISRIADEEALQLETALAKLIDVQEQNDVATGVLNSPSDELLAARAEFQQAISEVNARLVESAQLDSDSSETLQNLKKMTESQLLRTLRGHAILAAQLADVNRQDYRGVLAMAAAVEHDLHSSRQATLKEELEKQEEPGAASPEKIEKLKEQIAETKGNLDQAQVYVDHWIEPPTRDDKIWAGVGTLLTIALLWLGRYNMLQNISTVLVVAFTFITIGNVISLQMTEQFSISMGQFIHGLSFDLPESVPGEADPLLTALATFGIIGVGATELITYPYWCLEKGYARFTGKRDESQAWAGRAKGWMRVMLCDAFLSMAVYTVATIAFYIMGVAVLFNEGRDPEGMRMVSTLASAYVPVFGAYAGWLFLLGAIAVLYSTFLVANAGNARMYTDGCKVFGVIGKDNPKSHERTLLFFSALIPTLSFSMYLTGANPVTLVLISGMAQAVMLPMIGIGAVYFRYRMTDDRLRPSKLWDLMLIASCLGLLVTGIWGVVSRFL